MDDAESREQRQTLIPATPDSKALSLEIMGIAYRAPSPTEELQPAMRKYRRFGCHEKSPNILQFPSPQPPVPPPVLHALNRLKWMYLSRGRQNEVAYLTHGMGLRRPAAHKILGIVVLVVRMTPT